MTDVTKIDDFIQASPHPTWLATSQGECLYINPALERLTGLRSDQINQVDWRHFVLEEDRVVASTCWQRSLASGTPYRTTVRLRGFDGVPATVELVAFGHTLNDGTELWLFTGLHVHAATQQYPQLEAQLQATLNVIPAYTWYALPSGALTFVNKRTGDYLGLPKDHPLRFGIDTGAEWDAHIPLLHPDDREESRKVWSICLQTGCARESSIRIRNAEGGYRWFQTQVEPLRASDGTLLYWIGVNLDIDERKRAEEQLVKSAQELQRSELYLTEAQRLGHIGNWVFDPEKGFEYWSDELFRIHDLDPSKGPPNSDQYLAAVHPQDREFMASLMKRMLSNDLGFDVTKRIVRASGEVRYVRCVGTVDSDNAPSKRIGVGIDVTNHERLTQELRRREHELLGIIETIPSMLWSASPTGQTTHLSQRVLEYSGASLEELVNRGWERFIHPDDREGTVRAFGRAISSGESYSAIHRLRRADGEYRWHHSMAEPLRDPHGKIIQWYGLAIDIDERKRAEDHLRDTSIKLAKASRLATVAELAGSIAHELNQPLMSILANAQAAKRWLNAGPSHVMDATPSIERIIRDARAADETMQHIRALFKQESFDKTDVNFPEMLREVIRFVQEDPKKRNVPIECQFEGSLPLVPVDQIQIQQVFINLIVNAIEALEGQQVAPVVLLRARTDSNEMLIQVIDNGPGVDDPDRIFDAFMTTKENGMGIGLAVSRTIVEAHGGRLWAENNVSGGATLNVALPLSRASSTTAQIQEYA